MACRIQKKAADGEKGNNGHVVDRVDLLNLDFCFARLDLGNRLID